MVAPIGRIQAIGTGFAGAPGLMNFYWNGAVAGTFDAADATAAIAATRAFLLACAGALSAVSAWQVQNSVETFEATTGALIGVVAGTAVASVTGTAGAPALTAEGPLVQWITGTVIGRRLLRGRTFLVPSGSGAVQSSGTVNSTLVTAIQAAGATYIATTPQKPVIWHRPVPFKTGTNGQAAVISACSVPAKVAVLRSRRD